ncbi:MAG: Na+/H+ antiporter [Armatimonadetes bacterium]|nr:Na+/H+ antiporter [Armatimonadota bacterium]
MEWVLASAPSGGEFPVELLLTELIIIATVAIFVKYVRLPYTIALVAAGLGMGVLRAQHYLELDLRLTPELVFTIFLPALLFEAAFNLHVTHLRENVKPILLLAVPGVVGAALIVGYALHAWLGMPLEAALVFGALISATDPISVLALFKQLRAPGRLSLLVEGESLLNDGAAVVVFKILLALALTGTFSPAAGFIEFLLVAVGGFLLGLALGILTSQLTALVDDHLIEITLSSILAYGSYLLAERLGVSGVMAVIAAGLVLGNYGSRIGMSPKTQVMMKAFWDYAGFLMNSLVFLLIGTQVDLRLLAERWQLVLAAFAVVLLARACVVLVLSPLGGWMDRRPIPLRWQALMVWAGLRGSISMALAIGLPLDVDWRENMILMTFGVVIMSLFLQGLTISPLMRRLHIGSTPSAVLDYERTLGRLLVHERACQELERQRARYHITEEVHEALIGPHRAAMDELGKKLRELGNDQPEIREELMRDARHNVSVAQMSTLYDAHTRGMISAEVLDELVAELAATRDSPPPPEDQGSG